jgi:hypothetical protein
MIKSGEMPMKGYVLFHDESEMNESQREKVINWFISKTKKENHLEEQL